MDILLKQILLISSKDAMFKDGARYLQIVYNNDNREIMERYFTEAQTKEISNIAKEIYKANRYTQAHVVLTRCSLKDWD